MAKHWSSMTRSGPRRTRRTLSRSAACRDPPGLDEPVDVVQADRFIERYEEDTTLEPSEDWDPSLYALLNYPSVLSEMNEHLDWTEAMGDAV